MTLSHTHRRVCRRLKKNPYYTLKTNSSQKKNTGDGKKSGWKDDWKDGGWKKSSSAPSSSSAWKRSNPYEKGGKDGGKKGAGKQRSNNGPGSGAAPGWKSDLVRGARECLRHVVTCPAVMEYINSHEGIVCSLDQGKVSLRADTKFCCAVFTVQELSKKINGVSQTPNCPFEPCNLTHKTLDNAWPEALLTVPEVLNAPWPS